MAEKMLVESIGTHHRIVTNSKALTAFSILHTARKKIVYGFW
jgi:hypothetical protein